MIKYRMYSKSYIDFIDKIRKDKKVEIIEPPKVDISKELSKPIVPKQPKPTINITQGRASRRSMEPIELDEAKRSRSRSLSIDDYSTAVKEKNKLKEEVEELRKEMEQLTKPKPKPRDTPKEIKENYESLKSTKSRKSKKQREVEELQNKYAGLDYEEALEKIKEQKRQNLSEQRRLTKLAKKLKSETEIEE